ncbi:dedicator of cytokinesis protein 1 [Acrasis kona]|uniref:Dedicator of cytokinesis protein 1 n=1 Tax=Acrasis kona TaxID=1008807 RepID=A0AAW2YK08_9EUKA
MSTVWREVNKSGTVIFSRSSEGPYEIALNKGDKIKIKGESSGWLKVQYQEKDNYGRGMKEQRGLFPANYVSVNGEEVKFEKQDRHKYETVRKNLTPEEALNNVNDVLAKEIIQVLHEWGSEVIKLRSDKRKRDYMEVKKQMATLVGLRKTIIDQRFKDTDKKTKDEVAEKVIKVIEEGSRQLNLDLIVRVASGPEKGQRAHEHNTAVVDLFRQYQAVQQSEEGVRRKRKIKEDLKALSDSKLSEEETETKRTELLSRMIKGYDPQNKLQQVRELYDLPDVDVHFLLDVKACLFTVGESVEVFFFLYNNTTKTAITEEFSVDLTLLGMPTDPRLISNIKTLFTNVTEKNYLADLYLVVRIYRKGKMLMNNLDTPPSMTDIRNQQMNLPKDSVIDVEEEPYYRRPFGCCVLPLTPQVISEKLMEGKEYCPGNCSVFYSKDESLFPVLHQIIIGGSGNYEKLPTSRAIGIALGVTMFQKPLEQVLEENQDILDLNKTVCKTSMLEFGEIVSPGEKRSDLYVEVCNGSFVSDSRTVKITAKVITSTSANNKCIHRSTGLYKEADVYYHSSIYCNNNNPTYGEMFCIRLPPDQLEDATIVFTFSTENKKKKMEKFAVAFFPVKDHQSGVIKQSDQKITLELWKYIKELDKNIENYAVGTITKLQPIKDSMTISLKLVSTQTTQEPHLNNLIKWESTKTPLQTILYEFTFVSMPLIAQYSALVFNSLFDMISKKEDPLIFNTFLHIVDMLSKKQFSNYRIVIDDYIDNYFQHSEENIHRFLMRHLTSSLEHEKNSGKEVSQSLKAFHYMFKFIIVSRMYCVGAGRQVITTQEFVQQCMDIFDRLNKVMAVDSTTLVAAQDLTLKLIPHLFETIADIFPFGNDQNLGIIASNFIQAIPDTGRKNTIEGKLFTLHAMAHGSLLEDETRREIILPMMIDQIKKHIHRSSTERRICIRTVASLLATLQRRMVTKQESNINLEMVFSLMDHLCKAYDDLLDEKAQVMSKITRAISNENEVFALNEELKKISEVTMELFSSVLVLFMNTDDDSFANHMRRSESNILTMLDLMMHMIQHNPIPEYWIQYNVLGYNVIFDMIQFICNFCKLKHSDQQFDRAAWEHFFNVCITFAKCDRLQLEKFSLSKQSKLTTHGDLRAKVTKLLRDAWEALSHQHQFQFVPQFVDPTLRLAATIPQQQVYVNMLNVYCSLVETEFKHTGSLRQCQGLTAFILDEYIASDALDDKLKDYLVTVLSERFDRDPLMTSHGNKFLSETKILIDLIGAVKRYNDAQEDQKTSALLKVMQYVFNADQQEIFIKYLIKLSNVHATNCNYIEAGLTLMLYADKLDWNGNRELPHLNQAFVKQDEQTRKEELVLQAIDHFDKGKDWERANGLIQQLVNRYITQTGEYKKLAQIMRRQGDFYDKIMDTKRFYASYFYVAYYGKGFDDLTLRNNQYIYRGNEAERLMDFVERIMKRFPNAEMLKPLVPVSDEVLNGDGQYIQLITVYPVDQDEVIRRTVPKARNEKVSMNIYSYAGANDVSVFHYSRTFRMHPKDKEMNEISDLYTTLTLLYVGNQHLENVKNQDDDFLAGNSFPTIVRRKKILKSLEITLSPIQNAVKNIEDKNTELMELVISHNVDAKKDTNKLSMQLNGTIDAAVMGGVGKYLNAFFTDQYVTTNPGDLPELQRLQRALAQQLVVLEKGLDMYDQYGTTATKKHCEHLQSMFRGLQKQLAEPISRSFEIK